MSEYIQQLKLWVKRFILLLILYSVSRLFFYIFNYKYFSDINLTHLIKIFVLGIRFDTAAIIFTNLIFFIVILSPGNYKTNRKFKLVFDLVFFSVNALLILSNFIDAKYFEFINKRSTSAIFSLLSTDKDIWKLLPRFVADYWYIALIWLIVIVIAYRFMPNRHFNYDYIKKNSLADNFFQIIIMVLVFGLFLIGARGTGLKPVSVIDAANYTSVRNVPLLINTPFSIIKTLENSNLKELKYFQETELYEIYSPVHLYENNESFIENNVVIIILESFSKEYFGFYNGGKGYTPFLDSLMQHSYVFDNAFANGTQSNEAMPAIIAGIPSLMDKPYSGSNYATNFLKGLPYLLNEKGFLTAFFHGGNNGTMGFDNFSRVAGFSKYYGRNEYGDDSDYDGVWGIWDEPYLQYVASELQGFTEPFLASVFTLSSHHPYQIPSEFKDIFPEGSHPIMRTIGYADYALSEFFKTASQMDWYDNTLFVITADHAAQASDAFYSTGVGIYSIPIVFFNPSDTTLKGISNKTAQQIDIMPSILKYLNYSDKFFSFGNNLFDDNNSNFALSYINGIYQIIKDDYVLQFNASETVSFENWKNETDMTVNKNKFLYNADEHSIRLSMENIIKAVIQTYNKCLINNTMIP